MAPFRILLAALALMLATNAPGARQWREFERKTGTSSSAPHVERGNLIEERYRRLQAHYESLSRALGASVPSANAWGELPQSRAQSYQRLPKIIPQTAFAERSPRVRSFSYGWPLTERLLDLALEETARFEVALKNAAALGAAR
jgi:hypothetical protein